MSGISLWFLNSNLTLSYVIARICASIFSVFIILPLVEISHIWLSHIFSGRKFDIRDYPFLEFFNPLGAIFLLIFGYGFAKKFPYFVSEPENRSEYVFVHLIGPISSFCFAIIMGMILRSFTIIESINRFSLPWIRDFLSSLLNINVILTSVNIMPIPPLDGFKICEAFFPKRYWQKHGRNYLFLYLFLSILFISGLFDVPLGIIEFAVYFSATAIANIPFNIFSGFTH